MSKNILYSILINTFPTKKFIVELSKRWWNTKGCRSSQFPSSVHKAGNICISSIHYIWTINRHSEHIAQNAYRVKIFCGSSSSILMLPFKLIHSPNTMQVANEICRRPVASWLSESCLITPHGNHQYASLDAFSMGSYPAGRAEFRDPRKITFSKKKSETR